MLNERPPGFSETICPVDSKPCEGQGTDDVCRVCQAKLEVLSEENPCPEDDECVKMLGQGQRDGTVPTKVL